MKFVIVSILGQGPNLELVMDFGIGVVPVSYFFLEGLFISLCERLVQLELSWKLKFHFLL